MPVFLASDIYFLLAEAALNGHTLSGDAKSNFDKGILLASYQYLETNASNAIESGQNPTGDAKAYQTANAGNYLANYDLATSKAQRLEAIITQKYIASNTINSFEAWSDFRRTAYPKIQANGSATTTFVSISSSSPRPDKLPVRDIYPQTEYNLNPNTPVINNAFSSPIFWDLN
ncbi:SusD/RagB family nutrient-binding outer membrane lipoprotein [Pedobacter sp. NJ-S-72]